MLLRRYSLWRAVISATLLLASGLNTACTTWSRVPLPSPGSPKQAPLQVWQSDTAFVITEAQRVGDTLTGTLQAGRGRPGSSISMAVATADSARARQFDLGKTFLAVTGIGIAAFLLVGLAIYYSDSGDT